MPRVVGMDPGTVSIDVCGIDDGRLFLDRSFPTGRVLAEPAAFVALLEAAGPLDLVAGPSGYGLPLTRVQDATDEDLRLAFLTAPGESGGIGGLSALVRALARTPLPVVLTPGVVHLPTVPGSRKVDRGAMGAAAIAGWDADAASPERLGRPTTTQEQVAWDAFVEGAAKAAIALAEELPAPKEFVLSGRLARVEPVREAIRRRLSGYAPTRLLDGFAQVAKQGAQGAALVADGLAGGAHRELVETLDIREARG